MIINWRNISLVSRNRQTFLKQQGPVFTLYTLGKIVLSDSTSNNYLIIIHMEHGSISLLNIANTTSQWNGAYEGLGGKGKMEDIVRILYYSKKMNSSRDIRYSIIVD